MGAKIEVNGKVAVIEGVESLKGAPIRADDLRAGASLIIAALTAQGRSEIENVLYIDRGYEEVIQKFSALGADIERVTVDDDDNDSKRTAV